MMELLAPAGGMEQLKAAVRFGADAVYGGLNRFGLRAKAGNFGWEELKTALGIVHAAGRGRRHRQRPGRVRAPAARCT